MVDYKAAVLEERHLISILLFLRENGKCNKTAIYRNISTNPRIPDKLDVLEDFGLLTQEKEDGTQTIWLSLTSAGMDITEQLQDIDNKLYQINK